MVFLFIKSEKLTLTVKTTLKTQETDNKRENMIKH